MNEHQVSIGETTFGGREELVDTTAIMDYGSHDVYCPATCPYRPRSD